MSKFRVYPAYLSNAYEPQAKQPRVRKTQRKKKQRGRMHTKPDAPIDKPVSPASSITSFKLPYELLHAIHQEVEAGWYVSVNEAIRDAIRQDLLDLHWLPAEKFVSDYRSVQLTVRLPITMMRRIDPRWKNLGLKNRSEYLNKLLFQRRIKLEDE